MKAIRNTSKNRMAARLRTLSFALAAGLAAAPLLTLPGSATAAVSVGVAITLAPPPLPDVVQPVAPGPGYIWTPGYWAWGPNGYYWINGAWLVPPAVGLLWTPGWWGWSDGYYRWHKGYWGPQVGFYGGIDYGFGYFGVGYVGGHWRGRDFYYNRAVTNVNITHVHNVYVDKTVIHNAPPDRRHVSYNGGQGGMPSRPTPEQRTYARQPHPANAPGRHEPDRNAPAHAGGPGPGETHLPDGSRPPSTPGRQETHTPRQPSGSSWQAGPGPAARPDQTRGEFRERPQDQVRAAGRPEAGRPDAGPGQWRRAQGEGPRAEARGREDRGRHGQGGPGREDRHR
jgi:hypothetical protein